MKQTKAIINKIGTRDETGALVGWDFDCSGGIPRYSLREDGAILICGYTTAELDGLMEGVVSGRTSGHGQTERMGNLCQLSHTPR